MLSQINKLYYSMKLLDTEMYLEAQKLLKIFCLIRIHLNIKHLLMVRDLVLFILGIPQEIYL